MAFSSGTISANFAPALQSALVALAQQAGFTLIDTVTATSGSNTATHKILQSPTPTIQSSTWVLDIVVCGNSLSMCACETWDATAHTGTGFCGTSYNGVSFNSVLIPSGTFEQKNVAGAGASAIGYGNATSQQTLSSTFGWWASMTANRVILMTSLNPTVLDYAGLFAPFTDVAQGWGSTRYPIVSLEMNSNSNTSSYSNSFFTEYGGTGNQTVSGISRLPGLSTAPYRYVVGTGGIFRTPGGGSLPALTQSDGRPVPIVPVGVVSTDTGDLGILGLVVDVGIVRASSTVARGDTVSVGSDTWVLSTAGSGSSRSMCFKEA